MTNPGPGEYSLPERSAIRTAQITLGTILRNAIYGFKSLVGL